MTAMVGVLLTSRLLAVYTDLRCIAYARLRVPVRKKEHARFWFASHGFHQGRTIISNAEVHRRRRFVFNLDLEDFFGTINFGRVRGFFINDSMFDLEPNVATIIAQIALPRERTAARKPLLAGHL